MNPYAVILLTREKAEGLWRQDARSWKKEDFVEPGPRPKKDARPIRLVRNWFHALQLSRSI